MIGEAAFTWANSRPRESAQSYVLSIVKEDRKADLLFQCSDNTWNAYNRWPEHFALYDDGEGSSTGDPRYR